MVNSAALVLPSTDHQLLRQVAAGDEQAFDELYQAYNVAVYNYILRLIHEPNVAEDLLQEVFLAAWQGAARFRQESKVKTWLLKIAHYQTVSWLRRHHATSPFDDLVDAATDGQIEDHIVEAWEADRIWRALDQLSPKQRAVIELVFVQDLPYAEIAKILDCPIGTVKSRISYAMRNLTALLKQ